MKTMWKGAIQFGLVSIPVRMYTATEEKSVRFHQLHEKDQARIRYERVCSAEGEEVPYDEIVRGFEIEKDRYVVLTDEELDSVPVKSSRAIDISLFVQIEDIDPIYFQKTYYLTPEEIGAKPYRLLVEALQETGRVAVAKIAIREKEHLAVIRPFGEALVLETMHWPDEIRELPVEEIRRKVDVRPQELQMAMSLIENLTEEWRPEEFQDEYREALMDLIQQKAAGQEISRPPVEEAPKVVDLMAALKASVEASRKKGEDSDKQRASRSRDGHKAAGHDKAAGEKKRAAAG
jgi:DNA end-binding protein Ku